MIASGEMGGRYYGTGIPASGAGPEGGLAAAGRAGGASAADAALDEDAEAAAREEREEQEEEARITNDDVDGKPCRIESLSWPAEIMKRALVNVGAVPAKAAAPAANGAAEAAVPSPEDDHSATAAGDTVAASASASASAVAAGAQSPAALLSATLSALGPRIISANTSTHTLMSSSQAASSASSAPIVSVSNVFTEALRTTGLRCSARVEYVPLDGRSDGPSILNIIKNMAPRKVVIARGTPAARRALQTECLRMATAAASGSQAQAAVSAAVAASAAAAAAAAVSKAAAADVKAEPGVKQEAGLAASPADSAAAAAAAAVAVKEEVGRAAAASNSALSNSVVVPECNQTVEVSTGATVRTLAFSRAVGPALERAFLAATGALDTTAIATDEGAAAVAGGADASEAAAAAEAAANSNLWRGGANLEEHSVAWAQLQLTVDGSRLGPLPVLSLPAGVAAAGSALTLAPPPAGAEGAAARTAVLAHARPRPLVGVRVGMPSLVEISKALAECDIPSAIINDTRYAATRDGGLARAALSQQQQQMQDQQQQQQGQGEDDGDAGKVLVCGKEGLVRIIKRNAQQTTVIAARKLALARAETAAWDNVSHANPATDAVVAALKRGHAMLSGGSNAAAAVGPVAAVKRAKELAADRKSVV